MKKIITVQVEVNLHGAYKDWSNSALIDQFNEYEDIKEYMLHSRYVVIAVNDTVEDKADADETGTTQRTPEFDEGPTG